MKVVCLDTSIFVKVLVEEEGSEEAAVLLDQVIMEETRLVAPAFAWAEVGSVLRKKARQGQITRDEAEEAWRDFLALPIDFVNHTGVASLAWEMAERLGLPTLYDAAFLAVVENTSQGNRSFWTADRALAGAARGLGYVHQLGET